MKIIVASHIATPRRKHNVSCRNVANPHWPTIWPGEHSGKNGLVISINPKNANADTVIAAAADRTMATTIDDGREVITMG